MSSAESNNNPRPNGVIVASGDAWAIGWHEPVLFTLFHEQPTDADFVNYLNAAMAEIDECPLDAPRAVLYHAAVHSQSNAEHRRQLAEQLGARADKLARICTGFAFCTSSPLARGVLKVINWLSPPPYPSFEASNVSNGLHLLKRVDPRVTPSTLLAHYEALFAERLMLVEEGGR